MIRESYELLTENSSSKEKKGIYSSDDLNDNTFMGIINKYKNYRFEEHIEMLRDEFDCQSYSHISFYLEYKVNDFCQEINLFCATMEIFNREKVDYSINISDDITEIREPIVDDLLKNKYAKNLIKAIVHTKFYLNRSLDIENQYETEELEAHYDEGDDDQGYQDNQLQLPPIETPFVSDNCSICLTAKPDIIIIPCLHQSFCSQCEEAGKLTKCPTCRERINRKIKI